MSAANLFICAACVKDQLLSEEIVASGKTRKCMCCGGEARACWPLDAFAERVRVALGENDSFSLGEGTSPALLVEDLTGLSDSICEEIVDCWSENAYRDYADPEDAYSCEADACHAESGIDSGSYGYGYGERYSDNNSDRVGIDLRWQHLQEQLLHQSRAISCAASAFLDGLLADVHPLSNRDGNGAETQRPIILAGISRAS